jgi:vacuolar-type H+-ATPase subunit H
MAPPMPPPMPVYDSSDPDAQRKALQVLVLAQRTADEHIAAAQHQAETIKAEARAAADQVGREAAKGLSDARAAAEQIVREAQARASDTQREGDKTLADARAKATEIVKEAQANANELDRAAQQRYDDVVGSLATKRDVLQQQIDGLQQFDRDYRSRLRTFMHSQLRALGPEEPLDGMDATPVPTAVPDGLATPQGS